jgi:hypothetical protein
MEEEVHGYIYRNLNDIADVDKIHRKTGVPKSVLLMILTQKIVRKVKNSYHQIKNHSGALEKRWKAGESFLKISESLRFPPMLIASIILKEKGIAKREFRRLVKDPSRTKDKRVREEIIEAVQKDFVYSPWTHDIQKKRAKIGEGIIKEWLQKRNADFMTEKEALRTGNTKTPDFILKDLLTLEGKRIFWIDSKASFGDEVEHKRYNKKQFEKYFRLFGSGMVVYWYGFVDTVTAIEPMIIVKDYTFFREFQDDINELLDW